MATNDDIKQELVEMKKEQAEMKSEMKKEQAEMRSQMSTLVEEMRGLKTSFEQSQQPQNHTRILEAVSSVSFPWPVTRDKYMNRGLLKTKELEDIPALSYFYIEFHYWSSTDEIKISKVGCRRLTNAEEELTEKSGVIKMPYSGRYQFQFNLESNNTNGSKTEWYLCWKEAKDVGDGDDDETIKTKGEHGKQFLFTVVVGEQGPGYKSFKNRWHFGLECPQDTRVWLEPVLLEKGNDGKGFDRDYWCSFGGSALE